MVNIKSMCIECTRQNYILPYYLPENNTDSANNESFSLLLFQQLNSVLTNLNYSSVGPILMTCFLKKVQWNKNTSLSTACHEQGSHSAYTSPASIR